VYPGGGVGGCEGGSEPLAECSPGEALTDPVRASQTL
jgi:hypothetical protein